MRKNTILLIGALAREPELRYTGTGVAVYEATVAGEDHVTGQDGKPRQLPWYHRISLLGKPAEWAAEKGHKAGDPVTVDGTLDYSSWDAPEGGKRSAVRVKALSIDPLARDVQTVQDAGGGVRMVGGMNALQVSGNLTREPDLRYTPAGDAVVSLSIAVNEQWNDRQGVKQEKVHWLDITAWRELAEASKDLKKGDPILVTGRLTNESWTDKEGNKRSSTKIEAATIEPLARSQGTGEARAPGTQAARPAPTQQRQASAQPAAAAARPSSAQGGRTAGLDIDSGLQDFPPEEDLPF